MAQRTIRSSVLRTVPQRCSGLWPKLRLFSPRPKKLSSLRLFCSIYIVEYVLVLSIRLSKRRRVKEREKRCPRSPNAEMRTMDDFLPSLHLLFVFLQKMPLNSLFFANNQKTEKMEAIIWLLYLSYNFILILVPMKVMHIVIFKLNPI